MLFDLKPAKVSISPHIPHIRAGVNIDYYLLWFYYLP